MASSQQASLGGDAVFVRKHARALSVLPEPPETFMKRDLPPETADLFEKLAEKELIEQTGRNDSAEMPRDAYRWRVKAPVSRRIQKHADPPTGTPLTPCCLHTGFSNLRDGDFECRLCNGEFSEFTTITEDSESNE